MMEKKVLNITLICKKHNLKEEENVFFGGYIFKKHAFIYMHLLDG
jgi:hypothetical protein